MRRLAGKTECCGRKIWYYILSERKGQEVCFGLSVVYRDEEVQIHSVTMVYGDIRALLTRMKRGKVTPVAVRDVIEDWVLDFSCNFA
jgi:hypothetical protein